MEMSLRAACMRHYNLPGRTYGAPGRAAMTSRGLRLALAAMLLMAAGCQNSAGPPPIVLGHVANLSGIDPAGRHAGQGIDLALKEAADANIAEALEGRPLHVRHTDTRGEVNA